MKNSAFAVICLFLIISTLVFSQDTASPGDKVARSLYVKAVETDLEGGGTRTIARYLTVYLAEHTNIIIVEKEEEADCGIEVSITRGDDGADMLSVSGFDIFFDKQVFETERPIESASIIPLFDTLFPEILDKTIGAFPPRDVEVVEVIKERTVEDVQVKKVKAGAVYVTVTGIPGTTVTADTGATLVMDDAGKAEFEFPYDITVRLNAELPGFYAEKFKLIVGQENITRKLKQFKLPRFGITAGIDALDAALVPGFSYFFIPGKFFAGISIDNNIASIVTAAEGFYLYSMQMTPIIYGGWYFFPPENLFRLGVEIGIFTQIIFPFDESPYISKVMSFGAQPSVIFDVSPFKRVRFFLQYAPRFFIDSPDFRTENINLYNFALFPIAENFYFQYWGNLFFGVRIQL